MTRWSLFLPALSYTTSWDSTPGITGDAPVLLKLLGMDESWGIWWTIGLGAATFVLLLLGAGLQWPFLLPAALRNLALEPEAELGLATEDERDEFASMVGLLRRADMIRPNIREARRQLQHWQTTDFTREPEKSMRDDILTSLLTYLGQLEDRLGKVGVGTPPCSIPRVFNDNDWMDCLRDIESLAAQRKLDEARRIFPLREGADG